MRTYDRYDGGGGTAARTSTFSTENSAS